MLNNMTFDTMSSRGPVHLLCAVLHSVNDRIRSWPAGSVRHQPSANSTVRPSGYKLTETSKDRRRDTDTICHCTCVSSATALYRSLSLPTEANMMQT